MSAWANWNAGAVIALSVASCGSPMRPSDTAAPVTSLRYVRVHPVVRETSSLPMLVIMHVIVGDANTFPRTTFTSCTLAKVDTETFDCNVGTLGKKIPADTRSEAYIFDVAVGVQGKAIARDIYINGHRLTRVSGQAPEWERAPFVIRRDSSVEQPEPTAVPPQPTAVPRVF
jgi:hypothetical protein